MNLFEENNPQMLSEFKKELNDLIDKYHANLYLIEGVFEGQTTIIESIDEVIE